jgi:hypothetical protein
MTYVIQSIIPRGVKVMNVFNIKKQCDEKLIYSNHAIERARQRKVPMPSYIPFDAVCDGMAIENGETHYKLVYKYQGSKYCMVVSESMFVITVYEPTSPTVVEQIQAIADEKYTMKQHQRELRSQKTDEYYMLKEGKYRNMEFAVGYNSYTYA